jgi:O-antigen/teichoic acid export membrane protein
MEKSTSLYEKFKETGKHGIIYGIGAVIEKTITFILLPLYTTRFSASDYGILGLLNITGTLIATVFTIGINYGLLRSYYDYRDERNRKGVISTAFFILLISGFVLLVIGFIFSGKFSIVLFDTTNYRLHFIIIVITSFFNVINVIPFVVFRVKKYSLRFIICQIIFLLIGIGLIIYLVNYREWGVMGALVGNLAMAFITCVTLYIYIRKEIICKFVKIEFKNMLLMGIPLIPANISIFVVSAIDRYFLNYYSTTHEVGLYNLAYNFGNIITVLLATPISLIWPAMYLSVKEDKDAKEFYSRSLVYFLGVSLFLFLGVALLAKEIIQIVSNKEFWDAYLVLPILVLTYSFWSLRKIINVAIILKRKTEGSAYINIIGAGIAIGLNFLLVPRYGMLGAAYATFITYVIVILLMFLYNQKLMRLNYEWKRILKLLSATGVIFFIGYFIRFDNLILSIVFKIIIILLFPILLYLLRFYTNGEIQKIKEIFKSVLIKLKICRNS